jgi:hypothetical protein
MTKPEQPKPLPLPVLLLYGKPASPDLPQASWFRGEDRQAVTAAAQALKYSILDIATDADRALIAGVHEGVLKGNGRVIAGSVSPEVYKRIEDHVRKLAIASAAPAANAEITGANTSVEQNTNTTEKGPATPLVAHPMPTAPTSKTEAESAAAPSCDAWDALRVGAHVVGKYWDDDGTPYGWWIGVLTAVNGNDFIIRWPDEPKKSPLKIERKHVAILHPDFDVDTRVASEALKRRCCITLNQPFGAAFGSPLSFRALADRAAAIQSPQPQETSP